MKKSAIKVEEPRPGYLRPVSHTVGRAGNLLGSLPMLHPEIPFRGHTDERRQELEGILDAYRELLKEDKDTEDPDDLAVYLGAGRPWAELKKMWKRKEISTASKMFGTLMHPYNHTINPLIRGDHYNPISRTATVYNPEPGILAHELGHDVDFSRRKYKLPHILTNASVPGASLYYEAVATRVATKVLKDRLDKIKDLRAKGEATDEEVAKLEKQFKRMAGVLSPAYGSYVGGTLAKAVGPLGLAAIPIMRFVKPDSLVSDPEGVNLKGKLKRLMEVRSRFKPELSPEKDMKSSK